MLFDGLDDLLRIVVVGTGAYVGLVLMLRTTGKRTLSKMNAFDLVVTVAFGSTLSAALLDSDISLAEALGAFALLCALQYVVAFGSVRSSRFQALVKAEPSLLFFRGRFLPEMLRKERVTEDEILAAIRAQGIGSLTAAEAVVLETDGSFSVVASATATENRDGALRNVQTGSAVAAVPQ
ncbi:MAG: DUF421 domain-containing protein [Alphaproteobacteria bacterium]